MAVALGTRYFKDGIKAADTRPDDLSDIANRILVTLRGEHARLAGRCDRCAGVLCRTEYATELSCINCGAVFYTG